MSSAQGGRRAYLSTLATWVRDNHPDAEAGLDYILGLMQDSTIGPTMKAETTLPTYITLVAALVDSGRYR